MEEIILTLFGKNFQKNDDLYGGVLTQIFGISQDELPKKTPTFSESDNIEEILINHYLSQTGLNVKRIIILLL